jgi:hypothetical protein
MYQFLSPSVKESTILGLEGLSEAATGSALNGATPPCDDEDKGVSSDDDEGASSDDEDKGVSSDDDEGVSSEDDDETSADCEEDEGGSGSFEELSEQFTKKSPRNSAMNTSAFLIIRHLLMFLPRSTSLCQTLGENRGLVGSHHHGANSFVHRLLTLAVALRT